MIHAPTSGDGHEQLPGIHPWKEQLPAAGTMEQGDLPARLRFLQSS